MRLNVTLVVLVTVAALIAAGCGGGDDASNSDGSNGDGTSSSQASKTASATADGGGSGGGSSEALTKAQMIKQGDQICNRAGGRIFNELQRHKTEYGRGWGRQPTKKQNEEGLVDLVLPELEKEAEEIAGLIPPPGDEEEIKAIVEALFEGVEKTRANPSLAESRGASNPLAEASTLSQQYGFKVCGA